MNLPDRLRAALVALVEQLLARTDYHAPWPCEVVSQNEDGTLEIKLDDPARFGAGLSKVPVRGLPGVTAKVKQKARALLEFEGGNPARPVVTLWQTDSLEELTVKASVKVTLSAPSVVLAEAEGEARPVATVGSLVKVFFVETGVPGAPNEGIGYVTDGVNKVMAG